MSSSTRLKLTIKTLDSRNHPFEDLDPEMSIRELKEKISPVVGISPERQRLIYCGRVLDDVKKLKDHALDGKVLHLVTRLPRAPNAENRAPSSESPSAGVRVPGTAPDVNITIHHAPPFRGGVPNGSGATLRAPEIPRSSATVRLQLVNRMLQRANEVIDSLDNPGRQQQQATTTGASSEDPQSNNPQGTTPTAPPPQAPPPPPTEEGTNPNNSAGGGGGGEAPSSSEGNPEAGAAEDLSSLFSFPTGGETVIGTMAIQIETDGTASSPAVIVQNEGLAPLQRILQRLGQRAQQEEMPNSSNSNAGGGEASSTTSTSTSTTARTNTSGESSASSGTNNGTSTNNTTTTTPPSSGSESNISHPPPSALATALTEYNSTQARLLPHTTRLSSLLREDPSLGESSVREHQVFYNNVTQALHFLSHAQHAMSDILFNFSSPTPRVLRARPFLVHRPSSFPNVAISATATPVTARIPAAGQPRGASGNDSAATATPNNGVMGPEIGFTVEAQPIIVGIPSVRPPPHSSTNTSTNNNAPNMAAGNRAFISSETDFISSMIRATLGGIQAAAAAGSVPPQAGSRATATSSSANSSSGTQRSSDMNSGTQPTTSTRTRSSPHVHYAASAPVPPPAALGSGSLSSFDPFLPCNSHHILEGGAALGRAWSLDHHPIRRRTRHPAGFQVHHQPGTGTTTANSSGATTGNNANTTAAAAASSGNNTNTNRTAPSSTPPTPDIRRMALAQGIRELVLNQVMSPGSTPGNNAAPAEEDAVMFNIIQGILRYFVGALQSPPSDDPSSSSSLNNVVTTGNETMESFLRSLPDYNYVEGESILTDLLMTIIRNLSFRDLVTWIFGGGEGILNGLREPLAAFVRGQMLPGGSVEDSVAQFLDSLYPQMEEISAIASLGPDIDFPESLSSFLSQRLRVLVRIVLSDNVEGFGRDISREVSGLFNGLTALGMTCFSDGPLSIERVVTNQLGALCGHGLGPVARDQLMSIATGHLRNYIGGLETNSQEDVSAHVVRRESPLARQRKAERSRRLAVSVAAAAATNEDERFVTPPSSPERMDVEEEEEEVERGVSTPEEKSGGIPSKKEETIPAPVDPNQKFPGQLLKMGSQGPDMVVGSEAWHKSLPSEWVPIITRDVSRQKQQQQQQRLRKSSGGSSSTPTASTSALGEVIQESFVQAPFSDAYLSSQSAKRRKLAAAQKPDPGSALESVIAESLNEALSETGIGPLSDTETIAGNPEVLRSVEMKTKSVLKEKLSKDLDFAKSPESRFRASKAFTKD